MSLGNELGAAVTIWRSHAALLGKTCWRMEFLRTSGLSPELQAFDGWLFNNASSLPERGAAGGCDPERPTYGFLMQLNPSDDPFHGIAGVVGPSCDQAGRPFPLSVATPVAIGAQVSAHPEIAPLVLESYWQAASEVLFAVRASAPCPGDRSLEGLTQEPTESATGAFDTYVDWARQMRVGELGSLLERPVSWVEHAVRVIAEAVARPGRVAGPTRASAIRVPLGRAGGGALCFWLDVLRRTTFWRAHAPSFFWSHDGRVGDALLSVQAPDERTLATLWRVGAAGHDVWDLTLEPGRRDWGATAGVPSDADQTLWTLLQQTGVRSRGSSD
ncbi:MAG: type VI secretion system-associated protein TagF [Myxococcota bacterium]|nr:type VI secretion system-associated protein TagF [Myxococcota bacterium]